MKIDIFSDPVCPWCYIGKKRLAAALSLRSIHPVSIRWRAFQLNPDMPGDGLERDGYLNSKFGGPDRAREVYDRIRDVGQSVGIEFRFDRIRTTPNTIQSHRLVGYAQRPEYAKGDAVVQALFDAYFLDGRDIGKPEVLAEIAADTGLDARLVGNYLKGNDDRDDIVAEDVYARSIGINGVPCFIVDGKYSLSGAQEPESFLPLFDLAVEERRKYPASEAAI